MVGYGWIWLDTHKIQSNPFVCPCIQTNTTLHICLGQEKKKVRKCMKGGWTGSPLLGIHFENMWSWLDLVGYAKFRSFALVVCHRLQQRKLIPAKIEKHKKQTHNQNTESPKTTRQDSPEKTKAKNKSHKKKKQTKPGVWQVLIILCFASLFSFCVLWYQLFFKPLYSLCCSAQKPGIQKGSKQTPYSHFWLERKRRVKNVWKEGGTGPPLLRIHFLNFWVRYVFRL